MNVGAVIDRFSRLCAKWRECSVYDRNTVLLGNLQCMHTYF